MKQVIRPPSRIDASIAVAGDKSVSQRALVLNAIASGTAHVSNLCVGDDRSSVLRCLRGMGVRIRRHSSCHVSGAEECFEVEGVGPGGLREPENVLNAGNSGTAFRLVSGLAAGQPFLSVISGDRSLRRRPMTRIVGPLTRMGARIAGRNGGSLAPLAIQGGGLNGIDFEMPVASAQVKSSVLIAGLFADGRTTVVQPAESRDHTERMLRWMGADIEVDGLRVSVRRSALESRDVPVPGDVSSAAFWIVAACIHPNARIRLNGVGINPTRAGVIRVLQAMGARVRLENVREGAWEPTADIVAETSDLRGTEIGGDIVPQVIDELPILALAACMADGTTVIRDAAELRVKESDRIKATVEGLSRLGARIEERPDGVVVHGRGRLTGAEAGSHGDHRIAMTLGIAGLAATGQTVVDGAEAAAVSYPQFWDTVSALTDTGQ
jgi:3-phosphoshikimate 1-carboxyvinyltransferase